MRFSLIGFLNDAIGLSKKIESSGNNDKYSLSSKLINKVGKTIIYAGLTISTGILAINYLEGMLGIGSGKETEGSRKEHRSSYSRDNSKKYGKYISGTTH